MECKIVDLPSKTLVGMRQRMSLAADTTAELWRRFMPRRGEIGNRATTDYLSMQVYNGSGNGPISPQTEFEKWAVVEVLSDNAIPDGMESYALTGGRYAVFVHQGPASAAPKTMQYIFGEWLPSSEYELDDREHFEVLPESYDPQDPQAREEVWIPVNKGSR